MGDDPLIMDHLSGYVGNTAKLYESREDLDYKLNTKLISFRNYLKRVYLESKITNDRNKEGSKSG